MPKYFLIILFLTGLLAAQQQKAGDDFLYFSYRQLEAVKQAVRGGDPDFKEYENQIRMLAAFWQDKGPWSLADFPAHAASGNPQDYFSEGPYWWPDPDDPDAPYLRKDGVRNPERFTGHKESMNRMYGAVFSLSLADYFLDDAAAGERAAELLKVWFIDPDTRMNPHLNYGQAIRNRTTGRGVGIIETRHLGKLMEALKLLKTTGHLKPEIETGLKHWVSDYLNWLTTSKIGLQEKKQGNNHSSWWGMQVGAFALYTGQPETAGMVWDYFREYLIPRQMNADGSFPEEEARTLSLFYSHFNLDALSFICRLAERQGTDLWHFRTTGSRSMESAINYLMPYVLQPEKWQKKQIKPYHRRGPVFLAFAGMGMQNQGYLAQFESLQERFSDDGNPEETDPFFLLLKLVVAGELRVD